MDSFLGTAIVVEMDYLHDSLFTHFTPWMGGAMPDMRRVDKSLPMTIKPIVLLGDTRSREFVKRMSEEKFGVMVVDRLPKIHYEGMPWAFDNGCFSAWWNNKIWDSAAWHIRVDKILAAQLPLPLFAVTPDLPAEGEESLRFSRDWVDRMPEQFPTALALQDGMRFQAVKEHLQFYDYLFIGGSDAFKVQAADWVKFARDNGKKIHYARASTLEKLEWAIHLEVDSLDSSFPVVDKAKVSSVCRYFC